MKKRWKEQSGIMAIDATLSLSFVMILIMFLIDIGGVYQAQTYVYHGMLQTSKYLCVYAYKLDKNSPLSDTEELIKIMLERAGVLKQENLKSELKESWDKLGTEDSKMEEIVKKVYPVCLGGNQAQVDEVMKKYGLAEGMDSIDFKGTKKESSSNDLIIKAKYKVQLLWPIFGVKEIEMEQSTRSRMWDKGK